MSRPRVVALYDTPLDLDLDGDVPLPFGDQLEELTADEEVARLRRALVDVLGHVEAGTIPHGSRVRAWRELAGTSYVDGLTPAERAEDGIARAATRWTPEEVAAVDAAITTVARYRRQMWNAAPAGASDQLLDRAREFTTVDVWQELAGRVPITKGIAGRMVAARNAGIIVNTGRTTYPPADAPPPNNGQRLTVWAAA